MEHVTPPLVLTSLSVPQLRNLFRDEIESFFSKYPLTATSNVNKEAVLDVVEAAKYIRLSIPSIYRLVADNTLPSIKKGKKLLFEKSQLDIWLQSGRKLTLGEIQKQAEAV